MTMKTLLVTVAVATGLLVSSIAAADVVAEGKAIAYDRKKGNCLACHMMGDAEQPGNVAPPLISLKSRFPNKKDLYNQIFDARKKNPHSMMPPFGTHGILSDAEIHKVVEYAHTL